MDTMKEIATWFAQTWGARYPYWSSLIAALAGGAAWRIFVLFAVHLAGIPASSPAQTQSDIHQKAVEAKCGNIVNQGGTIDCKVDDKEKTNEPSIPTTPKSNH
jgi:hypothetical protein